MRFLKIALPAVVLACHTPPQPATDANCITVTEVVHYDTVDASPDVSQTPLDTPASWNVHFSPNGGCQEAIVGFIATGKSTIRVAAYGFTSQTIADALIAQKKAGLDVQVVLDKSDRTAKASKALALKDAGIPVFIDSKHLIMHDKVVVVDGKAVEFGSYNYTEAAEHGNAENCFIFHSAPAAKTFSDNWDLHKGHSDPF